LHIVIVGNGIAGTTAAIRLREQRPDWRITMVSGESTHPFSRPALMYVYMGHLRYRDTKLQEDSFWPKQRIELVRDWVVGVDTDARRVELHRGEPLAYDALLLATGSKPNRFGWPGQDLEGVQGLYSLVDLKRLYDATAGARDAAIVGGGLIGIELAEMLHSRGVHPTLLVREERYWGNVLPPEEAAMVREEIEQAGIGLRLSTELEAILDDGHGRARAVRTTEGDELPAQVVGLTAGVSPNLDLARETGVECGRGILVDPSLRASVEGVYAAGDCAELRAADGERGLVQQVWYTGKRQGALVADAIVADAAGQEAPAYDPGVWFNSAKFLDLEYQTYGTVAADGRDSLWWRDPARRRGLRIAFEGERVVGLNAMGLRLSHAVCERWIREERSLDHVVERLAEADFDAEFTPRFARAAAPALQGTGLRSTAFEGAGGAR
jgi:NAD(P)H-nitrite reductase large subunit